MPFPLRSCQTELGLPFKRKILKNIQMKKQKYTEWIVLKNITEKQNNVMNLVLAQGHEYRANSEDGNKF